MTVERMPKTKTTISDRRTDRDGLVFVEIKVACDRGDCRRVDRSGDESELGGIEIHLRLSLIHI